MPTALHSGDGRTRPLDCDARAACPRVHPYHIPELAVTIRRSREQSGAVEVDVAVVDGTLVAVERSQSLAVLHPPHVRLVVLGAREQKVALAVVLNNRGSSRHVAAPVQRTRSAKCSRRDRDGERRATGGGRCGGVAAESRAQQSVSAGGASRRTQSASSAHALTLTMVKGRV